MKPNDAALREALISVLEAYDVDYDDIIKSGVPMLSFTLGNRQIRFSYDSDTEDVRGIVRKLDNMLSAAGLHPKVTDTAPPTPPKLSLAKTAAPAMVATEPPRPTVAPTEPPQPTVEPVVEPAAPDPVEAASAPQFIIYQPRPKYAPAHVLAIQASDDFLVEKGDWIIVPEHDQTRFKIMKNAEFMDLYSPVERPRPYMIPEPVSRPSDKFVMSERGQIMTNERQPAAQTMAPQPVTAPQVTAPQATAPQPTAPQTTTRPTLAPKVNWATKAPVVATAAPTAPPVSPPTRRVALVQTPTAASKTAAPWRPRRPVTAERLKAVVAKAAAEQFPQPVNPPVAAAPSGRPAVPSRPSVSVAPTPVPIIYPEGSTVIKRRAKRKSVVDPTPGGRFQVGDISVPAQLGRILAGIHQAIMNYGKQAVSSAEAAHYMPPVDRKQIAARIHPAVHANWVKITRTTTGYLYSITPEGERVAKLVGYESYANVGLAIPPFIEQLQSNA